MKKRAYGLPSHCDINACPGLSRSRINAVRNGEQAVLIIKTIYAMDACMNLITDVLRDEPSECRILVIDDESDYATMPHPNLINPRHWKPMIQRHWNLLLGYAGGECLDPQPENPLPDGSHFNVYSVEYTATPQLPHQQAEFIPGMGRNLLQSFQTYYEIIIGS